LGLLFSGQLTTKGVTIDSGGINDEKRETKQEQPTNPVRLQKRKNTDRSVWCASVKPGNWFKAEPMASIQTPIQVTTGKVEWGRRYLVICKSIVMTSSQFISTFVAADQDHASSNRAVFLALDTVYLSVGDGSGRLLSLGSDFYALSATAADMLQRLLRKPMEMVVEELTFSYDISKRQIRNDLHNLLTELQQKNLVFLSVKTGNARRKNKLEPSPFLFPLLRYLWGLPANRSDIVWWLLAIARVGFHLWGWSTSVTCWQKFLKIRHTVQNDAASADRAETIDATIRHSAARHLMGMGCKERALACWFLLLRADIPADLVLGVNLYPLASHCWCESEGEIYSDDAERCGRYKEILRYRVHER
jgi:hypothetical protein